MIDHAVPAVSTAPWDTQSVAQDKPLNHLFDLTGTAGRSPQRDTDSPDQSGEP